jgi:hypothetical protein
VPDEIEIGAREATVRQRRGRPARDQGNAILCIKGV